MTHAMLRIDDAAIGTAREEAMWFATFVEMPIETLTVLIVPDARAYEVIQRVIRASSGGSGGGGWGWAILPESNKLPDLMVMVCHAQVARTAFAISDDALPLEGGPHLVIFDGEAAGVRVSRREPPCGANA